MADNTDKHPHNVPGRYYNDNSCIDCHLCQENAPSFFRRDEESAATYVWRQPETLEEIAEAEEALTGCPTETIGNDG